MEVEALREEVASRGYAFVSAGTMADVLGLLEDWNRFAASWYDMPLDKQLPDGHRYRRRRYATLSARHGEDTFVVEPHQPHYQSRDYNTLVGGIERWFEPMDAAILEGESFRRIVAFTLELFAPLRPTADWHIECHQFRIEARRDAEGQPTPEGVHRDGVDYVLVLLVNRDNIESGTTTVHDLQGRVLGSFTLSASLDTALVDDHRCMHGVTPVRPFDAARPAFRDVLVVTLRDKARGSKR